MAQNLSKVHWTKDALCKFDKSFTSYHIEEVDKAKKICGDCTVKAECIMAAAEVDSSFISAATSKYDRLVLQWKRVEDIDDSNFGGSDKYVSVILRQVRQAVRTGRK